MPDPISIKQAIVLTALGFIVGSAFRLSRLFASVAAVAGVAYIGLSVRRLGFERLLQRGVEMLDLLYAHPGMTGGFVLGLVLSAAWSKPESRD
jgi:cytochrome c biogenesis protein CcdA